MFWKMPIEITLFTVQYYDYKEALHKRFIILSHSSQSCCCRTSSVYQVKFSAGVDEKLDDETVFTVYNIHIKVGQLEGQDLENIITIIQMHKCTKHKED